MQTKNTLGLYIHIPFCRKKCHYCDFYTLKDSAENKKNYVAALLKHLTLWGQQCSHRVDTIYFGGGTPTLLLVSDFQQIMDHIHACFNVNTSCEITTEANPEDLSPSFCQGLFDLGFNRLSIGIQSVNNDILNTLGRNHSTEVSKIAIENSKSAGFTNISCDLIMGNDGESFKDIITAIDFLAEQNITHISLYQLKIEEGTLFHQKKSTLSLPSDDVVADYYIQSVEYLKKLQYVQYEISNFSKIGFESKHNLKYWQCHPYLGLGPSAHSQLDNKRFYYKKSLAGFVAHTTLDSLVFDENFDPSDVVLMGLRLKKGLSYDVLSQFCKNLDEKITLLLKESLLTFEKGQIALTEKGFLISNSILQLFLNE